MDHHSAMALTRMLTERGLVVRVLPGTDEDSPVTSSNWRVEVSLYDHPLDEVNAVIKIVDQNNLSGRLSNDWIEVS